MALSSPAGWADESAIRDNGPATEARLRGPFSVAADNRGNIYIADSANHRIRKVDPSGSISTFAGTGSRGFSGDGGPASQARLDFPTGVAVDVFGNLYFADSRNDRVRKVDPSGMVTTVAGDGRDGDGGDGGPAIRARLDSPMGVAVDGIGNIYIADTDNHRVRKIDHAGIISAFAGNGRRGSGGDGGAAIEARLHYPTGVAADAAGNVYIAERGNHRILRVDYTGTITTIAGGGAGGSGAGYYYDDCDGYYDDDRYDDDYCDDYDDRYDDDYNDGCDDRYYGDDDRGGACDDGRGGYYDDDAYDDRDDDDDRYKDRDNDYHCEDDDDDDDYYDYGRRDDDDDEDCDDD